MYHDFAWCTPCSNVLSKNVDKGKISSSDDHDYRGVMDYVESTLTEATNSYLGPCILLESICLQSNWKRCQSKEVSAVSFLQRLFRSISMFDCLDRNNYRR